MSLRTSRFLPRPQTSSYLDVTPSPSKLLTEHPLGAYIKTEEEDEEVTSCDCDAVKQEVKSEAPELPQEEEQEEEARGQEEVQADSAQS